MQTDGRRILLGPAWPKEWNAAFKLHAPDQTTVAGRVEGGRVVVEEVLPASRRKDIEILPLKTMVIPVPVSQGKPARASTNWHGVGYDAGKAVDGNDTTRWGGAEGARTGWLEVDLGEPVEVSRAQQALQQRALQQRPRQDVDSQRAVPTGRNRRGGNRRLPTFLVGGPG